MPDPSNSPPPTPSTQPHAVPTREAVLVTAAGFLGWSLDAFDYFLAVICSTEIAKEFGVSDADVTFSVTLTLMFRPVGAFIFGLLSDRYGRRIPMIANLIFYSAVEVATGFAPTLTAFLVLRALFGIGMGGEWGVGASLVMEKVPAKYRGLISGLLQEGYATGYLLAAVAAYFMLDRFGWRPMFYLGGIPALLALFIRLFIKESEVWQKSKAESWTLLRRGILSNWKLWVYLTILMAMMNFSSHGTQDKFKPFLATKGMDTQQTSSVIIVAMIGAIIGGVTFGFLSDRFGRRKMMIAAFIGALAVTPLWALASHTLAIFAGAFLMQFMVQGAWGIIPAHINELSPDRVRGFFPGFAYQCGNLISASIAQVQATLVEKKHYPYTHVMLSSALIIFTVAILVIALGKERRGMQFGVTNEAHK